MQNLIKRKKKRTQKGAEKSETVKDYAILDLGTKHCGSISFAMGSMILPVHGAGL